MDQIETKYLARARHAQAVVEAFAGDVEEICRQYRMHPEVKDRLRRAAKLARMSIRKPVDKVAPRVDLLVKAEARAMGEWQPETEFPSVGPPGHELYRQGLCRVCGLLLIGEKPERRDYCGVHEGGRS